jgi:phosphoribosylformylglycinamidine synthase
MKAARPDDIPVVNGFIKYDGQTLEAYRQKMGLAMDFADLAFLQEYFKKEDRDPTETEIRVLDTYWSDHCRHTTFLTVLDSVEIEPGPYADIFKKSLEDYTSIRTDLYAGRSDKPVTLMDMACIGAKYLKKVGKLDDLEVSGEINACSVFIDVHYTTDKTGAPIKSDEPDATERWLLMFKNETHNHPTEIEPFGGAATCIGGAIRDPLSGRSWVYQAMRVTGAADPTVPLSETMPGKTAAAQAGPRVRTGIFFLRKSDRTDDGAGDGILSSGICREAYGTRCRYSGVSRRYGGAQRTRTRRRGYSAGRRVPDGTASAVRPVHQKYIPNSP